MFRHKLFFEMVILPLAMAVGMGPIMGQAPALPVPQASAQPSAVNPFAAVTIITGQEITDNGLRSLADVLRLVPGMYIQQNGEYGAPAYSRIRGTNTNQILVLVNGERVTNPSFGTGTDLSRFTTEDITRIEITRGILSSSFGANAIGGVINIITEEEVAETSGKAEFGMGTDGRQARTLLVNGAGKTPWKIGVISPVYDGSQPNSAFSATRYFAGLAPSLKDWKVKVQAHHYQDSTDLFSWRYELPPAGANTPIWVRDLDDHQSTGRTSYSLSASKPVALGGFGFNSYRIEQELDQTLTTSTETFLPNVTGQTDSHNFFYNHTVNNHNIRFGGELRKEKYDSFDEESLLSQSEEITDRGLYLEDQWSAGEKHYITAGLRYDDHSIAGGMFSPRFGVIKLLPPNMKLRVAYAEGFRPPGFLELYAPDTGNSDLDAEKGKQYEFAWSIVKGKNTVEVISFQYDIRNLIVLSDEGTPQYVNLDKTRQRGGEIVWQRQQSPKFSYALSYTYVSAENRITEERLPDIPRAMAAVTARYNFGKWQALLTGWYNDNHRLNAEVEVPERIVLDLSVVGSVNKLCQPYLIIRNLTNERLLQEEDDFTSDGRKIEVGLRSVW